MVKCIERAESHCRSYPRCDGCGAYREPTNADRMIAMIQNGEVSDLLDWWQEIFEDGVPGDDYFAWWLELPVKDGEGDGNGAD